MVAKIDVVMRKKIKNGNMKKVINQFLKRSLHVIIESCPIQWLYVSKCHAISSKNENYHKNS